MDEIFNIFNKIKKIYVDNNFVEMCQTIEDNQQIFNDLFDKYITITEMPIKLDYNIPLTTLYDMIESEKNNLFRSFYILLALHHMFYIQFAKPGNHYLSLSGMNEMCALNEEHLYYMHISTASKMNNIFHALMIIFGLESLVNNNFYVGMDLEQTNKQIKLCQLNFEHYYDTMGILIIVAPPDMSDVLTNNFIKFIICNKKIKKIMHGADALDMPYLCDILLKSDKVMVKNFIDGLIDTRFLCEYYKLNLKDAGSKCKIYDENKENSALYYFNVINETQQEYVAELTRSMPPHFDIQWDIYKMPKSQILYALRDVLYLKVFYYRIISKNMDDGKKTNIEKSMIIHLYKNILFEITHLVLTERFKISETMVTFKHDVDPINNYFIRSSKGTRKLIDIFTEINVGLVTTDPEVHVDYIYKVNFFKNPLIIFIKRLVYGFLSMRCRIYKDKSTLWPERLTNTPVLEFLNNNYPHLGKFMSVLAEQLDTTVIYTCR